MLREAAYATAEKPVTPKTDAATFVITTRDVGSKAVRPGLMAEMEEERKVLLLTCVTILNRVRGSNVPIGATYEFMLESAIKAVSR